MIHLLLIEPLSINHIPEGPYKGMPEWAITMDEPGVRFFLAHGRFPIGVWREALGAGIAAVITSDGRRVALDDVYVGPDGMCEADPLTAPITAPASGRAFVHLHSHSEYSPLDGLATIEEMVDAAIADGQEALALTDHGVCSGHVQLQTVCRKKGIKPIFGVEAYLVNDRAIKTPAARLDYWHLVMLAQTEEGLRNLWAASTEAELDGFHYRPRMDWDVLERHSSGIIVSTACLRGPLSDLIQAGDDTGAKQMLARMQGIFGDRLYLELHTNQLESQRKVNEGLVSLAQELSVPTIVVADSHYACMDDHQAHKVWIAAQTDRTLQDEQDLFSGDEHYHISTVDEVAKAISYLPERFVTESIANTAAVAAMCDATIKAKAATPVYHRKLATTEDAGHARDAEEVRKICEAAWEAKVGWRDGQDVYRARFEEEMTQLTSKRFCGYLLIVYDYCNTAHTRKILMGPGRGSAAGSLVCFLMGITGIDPIEARLLFERFISPGRTSLPDIDSDFPSSKRDEMTRAIIDRWGEDHVVQVGTEIRLKNKGVIKDVARVFKGSEHEIPFKDQEAISKIIEEAEQDTAGLGLSWEELWAKEDKRLTPWQQQYPEVFKYAEKLVGRLKSYGKHPAGIVIDPMEPLMGRIPLRRGERAPVAAWPMTTLDELGLVKFDILTLRTLDTIQAAIELIRDDEQCEIDINPNVWREEYDDPAVWDMLCEGDTIGVFQIETPSGTRLTQRFQPRSIDDLCAILTLVRPGPMRSGLTESFIARRAGIEAVEYPHPLLEEVLAPTFGTMIYQEDIMAVCKILAGYSSEEADEVRSILGKKKVEKIVVEGERFVARCFERGIDRDLSSHLWEQMAEFARYSFNRSHSWSYALLAYWCAWLKCHYPAHFYVALLSTVKKERIPEFVNAARNHGFKILLPDVNKSLAGFSVEQGDRQAIRYGLSSIMGLGDAATDAILANRPYSSWDDFVERRGDKCNWGHVKTLAFIGALDGLVPDGYSRVDLEDVLEGLAAGQTEKCRWQKDPKIKSLDGCGFDWNSEPVEIGKSGKPLKRKPIPKACTRACRQYDPVSAVEWKRAVPLMPKAIRQRERETLGVYVSSTPFDSLDFSTMPQGYITTKDFENLQRDAVYYVVGEVEAVKKTKDKSERTMAWVTLTLIDGKIEFPVFSSSWEKYHKDFVPGQFGQFAVRSSDRGFTFNNHFVPIQ